MRSSDNGNPIVCAQNLLLMIRGECPMDRLRGRNPELIGRSNNLPEVVSDAQFVIRMWEPRLDITQVKITPDHPQEGDFRLIVEVDRREDQ